MQYRFMGYFGLKATSPFQTPPLGVTPIELKLLLFTTLIVS